MSLLTSRRCLRVSDPALILLLCAYVQFIDLSRAQLPTRRCNNTAESFLRLLNDTAHRGEIYEQLKPGDGTSMYGVCKLDETCCSQLAEITFKMVATEYYQEKIQRMLADALMPCHNHTEIISEIVRYIASSKDNLVSVMKKAFSTYFSEYVTIFDEFYEYLEMSLWTGDLCEIEEKFVKVSFEVFQEAYVQVFASTSPLEPGTFLPNTEMFRLCFTNLFLELKGDSVYSHLHGFLRAFNLTLRYTRALKMLETVVEGVLDLNLTVQCRNSLMKMTHCSQCAGYSVDLLPCQGLCLNSLRGCLIDLVDLIEPLRNFTDAIAELNRQLDDFYKPWDQITLLSPYFLTIVTEMQRDIDKNKIKLFLSCNAFGQKPRDPKYDSLDSLIHIRRKRNATTTSLGTEILEESADKVRLVRQALNEVGAPDPPTFAAMNQSDYCIANALSVFTTLAEELCGEASIAASNTNCWTGTTFGSYERTVIDLNRAAQVDNPELIVCPRSRLKKQIAQLNYITREMSILTGVQIMCSQDDEDCVDSVPQTCNYYDFSAISYSNNNTTINGNDVIDFISGSGSGGTERGTGEDGTGEDDENCAVTEMDFELEGGTEEGDMITDVATTEKNRSDQCYSAAAVKHLFVMVFISLAWTQFFHEVV